MFFDECIYTQMLDWLQAYMYMHVYPHVCKLFLISLKQQYLKVLNSTSLPCVRLGQIDQSDQDLMCIYFFLLFSFFAISWLSGFNITLLY